MPNRESEHREIAYCAPVMNRFSDIQSTLAHNLAVLKQFDARVQLIIACFDADTVCKDWVGKNFSAEMKTGLLRFESLKPLPHWHFSWAKNSFCDLAGARYYSSLDGDNFLSEDDIEKTLSLTSDSDREYIIHHFSGTWGDGTSGRITIPGRMYRQAPYINELMPRQFDEIGVILRLLTEFPSLVFVSRPGVNIFDSSRWCRDYLELNGIHINHKEMDLGAIGNPLNPREKDYIEKDEKIFFFHKLNAAYTFWKISNREPARQKFFSILESAQREYANTRSCIEHLDMLFSGAALRNLNKTGETTLYAVNRNNFAFLEPWISHYRDLGVQRFIIVDDDSEKPLEEELEGKDIHVVRPHFGVFRSSKVFWLKALMTAFQKQGTWVLTADVDEFLDLEEAPEKSDSKNSTPLARYLSMADSNGWNHAAGILLDMMPSPDAEEITEENFLESMEWHYFRPVNTNFGYQDLQPVQWAFGDFWPISFAFDIRYRLYGTIDCLRKVPLVRFYPEMDLNQGFHTLLQNGKNLTWQELLIPKQGLLPIRHYKMTKVFSRTGADGETFERAEQYFERTRKNLERISGSDPSYVVRSWRATPFKRRYTGPSEFPFYHGFQSIKAPEIL
ncbi:MAG: glycosyltransferase family 2 protein [Desulfobacterales bacterium]|jgi:hypothetical protein|nr:glycosyltransferase family 2 protein [Desulfobacterales bacterium]